MELTVINGRDGIMHVHKAGCRDIARQAARSNGQYDMDARSCAEIVREIWSDFADEWDGDMSTGDDCTHIYPCVTL